MNGFFSIFWNQTISIEGLIKMALRTQDIASMISLTVAKELRPVGAISN
ncbi:hypothetical protein [Microseira wollei]|uniref:Transposase n=1 Tax=Microseira wollei NIES-4236 TaxID=2530354 RepID=A0AAV3XJT2_9CYAN|nr:hypothetical protein [Microseira wollei]GET39747.1 hypothetical protein MiSe_45190 [Microseira wollei NIES-4236]